MPAMYDRSAEREDSTITPWSSTGGGTVTRSRITWESCRLRSGARYGRTASAVGDPSRGTRILSSMDAPVECGPGWPPKQAGHLGDAGAGETLRRGLGRRSREEAAS